MFTVYYSGPVKIVEAASRDGEAMAVDAQQSVDVSRLRDPETLIMKVDLLRRGLILQDKLTKM